MLNFSPIRAVLFDMDGVIYRGKTPMPGIHEILAFCQEQGIKYACITNNSSKTPQQFEEKLASMGIEIAGPHVISSALATADYMRQTYPPGTTAYVIGMRGLQQAIFGDNYFVYTEQHPYVVALGVDMHVTYEKFKIGCLAIQHGADYIVSNTDVAFPSEEGLLPGAGALAIVLQTATGVKPFVVGKPQLPMFQSAMRMLDSSPATTLVIGDRLETDIAGARNAGLQSALVLTGVTKREHVETSIYQPDAIFDNLLHILEIWKQIVVE